MEHGAPAGHRARGDRADRRACALHRAGAERRCRAGVLRRPRGRGVDGPGPRPGRRDQRRRRSTHWCGTSCWRRATRGSAARSPRWPRSRRPAVKRLFGVPDTFALAAVVPLGRPVKQLTRLRRQPGRGVRDPRALRRRALLMPDDAVAWAAERAGRDVVERTPLTGGRTSTLEVAHATHDGGRAVLRVIDREPWASHRAALVDARARDPARARGDAGAGAPHPRPRRRAGRHLMTLLPGAVVDDLAPRHAGAAGGRAGRRPRRTPA